MYINIESVSITPSTVKTGQTVLISVGVQLSTYERLKNWTHKQLSRFTHDQLAKKLLK